MCKLEDLIDKSPLSRIIKSIERGKNDEATELIRKSISPQIVNSKLITFTAWNIDVTGTVYSSATPIDIMDGWKFLINENIPLDVYAKAFYVNSIYTWLEHNPKENIQVNSDTNISNILEPETSEILRLCYWINRCKQIITDKKSFEDKFVEIKNSLCFENQLEVKQQTDRKLVIFGRIMKDTTIPYWERKLHADELMAGLENFRSNISSVIPELMIAALVHEAGFAVKFIAQIKGIKTCDLVIKSYKAEVKTFLDVYTEGSKVESDLLQEIEGTLRREKAVKDINDSLLKKAELVLIFLTFSSLAVGFAKYTFEKRMNFQLSKAMREAISLAEQNRSKPKIDRIPVIVFTTLIDVINCDYKIFFHAVSYPVKIENNMVEADPDNLHLVS